MKKSILLVAALLWVFTACNEKKEESNTETKGETPAVTASNSGTKASAANNTGAPANLKEDTKTSTTTATAEKKADDNGPKASIKFNETTHDFGEINEGTVAKHTFQFTNNGDVPLVIKSARGSCGCTVPDWPKEPIAPGKTGEIKVQFNSSGKPGTQSKTVTLTTNTEAGTEVLNIKAQVKAKATVNGPVKK
jgi:hypothetical protein